MINPLRPFEYFWDWLDKTGGYPGKMMFAGLVITFIVLGVTWLSNRR